ncbi:MAG: single-stranded DNA-binding protein [Catonella sp.]|jgi:single-strand DNA-binding protein|nr:single-stranded DNA-binding protein [Catonella sp.]MDY6357723.1 single-stranded DNA-binding protein [Catonella sp.]
MNKVIMMGRLTRDPEVRYSSGENSMAIAKFSIAVDRRNRRQQTDDQPTADFFNCTAFGKQGEFVEKYLKKGTKILLTGRVQNDNYTNKNGEKVYSVQIIVEELEFAESKAASAQGGSTYAQQGQGDDGIPFSGTESQEGFMNIPNAIKEELPF